MITLDDEEVTMKLVKLSKRPKIIEHKIFKMEEGITRIEEVKVKFCGTTRCG